MENPNVVTVPLPHVVGGWCPGNTNTMGCPDGNHPCLTSHIVQDTNGNIVLFQYPTCAGDGGRFNPRRVCCSQDLCFFDVLVMTHGGLFCLPHAKILTDRLKRDEAALVERVFGPDVFAPKKTPSAKASADAPGGAATEEATH